MLFSRFAYSGLEEGKLLKKTVSAIMLALLLASMTTLAFKILPSKASGTIYIRADGSIDPPTAPISTTDNVTYTFTGNINDSIVVERDNIVVDGASHTIHGEGSGYGIDIYYATNVTIRNTAIKIFGYGIRSFYSSDSTIVGNSITDNQFGIWLAFSSYNTIFQNIIENSSTHGIWIDYSSNNTVSKNNITDNWRGIWTNFCSDNRIYHNNLVNNTIQAGTSESFNLWDDDYPSGGNYWSNYGGVDLYKGSYQNETGSDGIGDTPHIIDENNKDNYPLMGPFGPLTLEGENATVFPSDDVGLIFDNVTVDGFTTVSKTGTGPELPSGFKLTGQYYEIETTASYSGKITIRIIYDGSGMTQEEEESLQLMQWNETTQQWMNITTYIDTENNVIYGETTHLCMFAVMSTEQKGFIGSGGSSKKSLR